MPETIIFALIFAKIRKYKIKPLFKIWQFYIILCLEAIYLIFLINFLMGNYSVVKYMDILNTLYLAAYLLLIIRFKLYKSALLGTVCILIGSLLNQLAINANGGKMPVFPRLSRLTGLVKEQPLNTIDNLHILGSEATKLIILTDIIDIGYTVLSIGDIFIRIFVFIIIYNTVKYLNKNQELA